ncbi:pyruvate kinase [Bacillus sp. EB600]|uniref:pyruvate kinase n=1 Tax=Bacillus sp. EB600 TaxID=2806345 RepID=UPI00210E997E|nr:pyruvate kinase [Bacillus sp. EB600]MCQ6282262.1 pyruvate kinase [Bacillus sp. EB600]
MSIDRVCTIGPASSRSDTLSRLISNGMNIIRLNMSHGTHDSHKEIIQLAGSIEDSIRIVGDLQGPKIRLGEIEDNEVILKKGDTFTLYMQPVKGNCEGASVDYSNLAKDVKEGSQILINDGQVELSVGKSDQEKIQTIVKVEGPISSHKGVNVPGTEIHLPAITEKDKEDIEFLLAEKVDYLACSFVRKPSHITEIRDYIKERSTQIPKLIAKIETIEALTNFPAICQEADGIMIARGDLGVEVPYHWIPLLQKAMIHECNRTHTYVIVATQMLQSMVESSLPTRAEVTDVFQAVLDGANAVMLSAESAAGDHPIESVETLTLVSQFAEKMRQEEPFDFEDVVNLISNKL